MHQPHYNNQNYERRYQIVIIILGLIFEFPEKPTKKMPKSPVENHSISNKKQFDKRILCSFRTIDFYDYDYYHF